MCKRASPLFSLDLCIRCPLTEVPLEAHLFDAGPIPPLPPGASYLLGKPSLRPTRALTAAQAATCPTRGTLATHLSPLRDRKLFEGRNSVKFILATPGARGEEINSGRT